MTLEIEFQNNLASVKACLCNNNALELFFKEAVGSAETAVGEIFGAETTVPNRWCCRLMAALNYLNPSCCTVCLTGTNNQASFSS